MIKARTVEKFMNKKIKKKRTCHHTIIDTRKHEWLQSVPASQPMSDE